MRPTDAIQSTEVSRHIPALDGLRAVAILLVVPHHLDLMRPPVPGIDYPAAMLMHSGWIGVQLFFVLSGFLITGNLLDTRGSDNYFSAFFGRRALRILPLYFAVLTVAFVITPALVTLPRFGCGHSFRIGQSRPWAPCMVSAISVHWQSKSNFIWFGRSSSFGSGPTCF